MAGIMWVLWGGWLVPQMWRWHVELPRARRRLIAEPDSSRKERDLRRINKQLDHLWAGSEGKILFALYTVMQVGITAFLIVNALI